MTSRVDTASLLSSDVQTATLSGYFFSHVLIHTPVAPNVRLAEYFARDPAIPPTPKFADYSIRVDSLIIYDAQTGTRFPIFAERSKNKNETLSNKNKRSTTQKLPET